MNNKAVAKLCCPPVSHSSTGRLVAGILLIGAMLISGCSGLQTFSHTARAGDTVTLSVDRQPGFTRNDVDIQITDFTTGYVHLIPGSDPAIRGWINTYPDPVSKMIIGRETSQGFGVGAKGSAIAAETQSNGGKDWFTTMVLLDLPTNNLFPGTAAIDVLSGGQSILLSPMTVEIIPGAGSPNQFDTFELGALSPNFLKSNERADHYTVSFSGTVPAAIQVDIAHDPDRENGGSGQAYVTQPRSDINALSWTDDGSSLRVVILPAWNKSPEDIVAITGNDRQIGWFDFYIAGGITGLQPPEVTAYDEDGAPVPGVMATIQ